MRLRPVRGRQTRIKYVIGLKGLAEVFRHSWYQSKKFEMADRRDWGGGGDDLEESTQRMIERIWECLTDIRAMMDQQAPVPPVAVPPGDGETVPIAPVPPGVEVPFAAPVPPPPPVLLAEEPVMQVEKFLRLQPPTYSEEPNPDTAEHWVHEIERNSPYSCLCLPLLLAAGIGAGGAVGGAKLHNYCDHSCPCSYCNCRYFYLGVNLLLKLLSWLASHQFGRKFFLY
ncbi:hypothetical protein Taro_021520 [Colocasia esculenta]|uniref:Uncharacterized protein n=1 Tax=Colocasia esculenta TaxID=4460 RepID=A0A843URN2_COLES|nr:hypothetical protein [Colocasia esculenta]